MGAAVNKKVSAAVKRSLIATGIKEKAREVRSMRDGKIKKLQQAILQLPQSEFQTEHFFADGMYLRYLPRRAGTVIIGKTHKKEHFYLVLQGAVRLVGDNGPVDYRAPAVIVSKPGTKRAVYALEDSVCATVHRTDKTDLNEIEEELVERDPDSPYGPGNVLDVNKCLSLPQPQS